MSSETEIAGATEQRASSDDPRGILFVVSSPSGGGKGTLIKYALQNVANVSFSVSYTTRPARPGEVHGREYFFVTEEEFLNKREAGEFLEWAMVHGHLYATSRSQVARELGVGHDIILEIDVQGAASLRSLSIEAVSVFILPPSFEHLRNRLHSRGSESSADVEARLVKARVEVDSYKDFDYVIINDDAERAGVQLASIVYAERARRSRQERIVSAVLGSFKKEL